MSEPGEGTPTTESVCKLSVDGRFPGPAGHCMEGIVQGMQSFLIVGEKEEGAPLL